MNDPVCLICDRPLHVEASAIVKQRGIETLAKRSIQRNDNKYIELQGLSSVVVHERCRKIYSKEKKGNLVNPKICRQRVTTFDFKKRCVICAEDASEEFVARESKKPLKRRNTVHCVLTMDFKDSLLAAAEWWQDKDVLQRINQEIDLVAAEGRYHHSCSIKFLKKEAKTSLPVGRPEDEDVSLAFNYICKYIEQNEDQCQFTLLEILEDFKGFVPTHKALLKRLKSKYEDDIIVTSGGGKNKPPVICFRNTGYKILTQNWYDSRNVDAKEERLRIVKAAAAIIREDIRSEIYPLDTYPKVDEFLKDIETDIPESLKVLVESIVNPKKGKTPSIRPKQKTKTCAIAHAIISAARPRSFLSPLLVGLGATLHKKYGSRDLLEVLSSLGFCCSYSEVKLFQASVLQDPPQVVVEDSFCQWVYDNADVNVDTIDGFNTFHSMGGLQCITPHSSAMSKSRISRLKSIPKTNVTGKFGNIPLATFQKTNLDGLKSIQIYNINAHNPVDKIKKSASDFMWLYGKCKECLDVPGWNGFMEKMTSDLPFQKTRTLCLPFLNAPPGNPDTIYSVLLDSVQRKGDKQKCCFVTFDQPLYYKAREIVASCNTDSPLSSVIVRLGGFHLLMSFMGAIGYIMDGSGLQDILSTIYARHSTEKMLMGHAYSRALRGHILVHLALAKTVLSTMAINDNENQAILDMLDDLRDRNGSQHLDEPALKSVMDRFYKKLSELEKSGPTAKLWVQYLDMVSIVKQFIEAERTGDWQLHIETVQRMLPYFHSSGHFLYAKSCHLYLQDMLDLEQKLSPDEYDKFTNQGFFTIRRSDKFWSGVFTDQTIEQVVMRSLKCQGGLSHGRGITDSTLVTWVATIPTIMEIGVQLEEFCGVTYGTSDQHVDARLSRVRKDDADISILHDWFLSHYPFPSGQFVMSISTGVTGDEKIDCHEAYEKGTQSIAKIVGNDFKNVKFQRKNRVVPLKAYNSKVRIHNEDIPVNPDTLFRRITLLNKSEEQLKNLFEFELAPYPLSLFDEIGMRKTKRSVFYNLFSPVHDPPNLTSSAIIIDGGFLLHRVVWECKETFSTILSKYVDYIKKYYNPASTTIVFDGYPDEAYVKSTKSAERLRRNNKQSSSNVVFTEKMTATMPKEQFLSNDKNKARLISMLSDKLVQQGFEVKQAFEDADTLIVNTAIEVAENFSNVIIIGEDTDLLIILTGKAPNASNIYVMKPGKGISQNTFYSPSYFNFSSIIKHHILFLHAISGCDTTSAFYRQGKMKFVKLLKNNLTLQEAVKVFQHEDADPDALISAGLLFLAALYTPKVNDSSLDKIRFKLFSKSLSKLTFNLASLPPTNAAASQHILRVYHQIQGWHDRPMDPLNWGLRRTDLGLLPIMNTRDPAPAEILNIVSCGCTKGCTGKCSCRKIGMKCSKICLNCHGQSCLNSATFEDEGVTHVPIGIETETGEDSPFEDDPDEHNLDFSPHFEAYVNEGPSTSKKIRT